MNEWKDFYNCCRRIFYPPGLSTVTGVLKSGKTDFALFLGVDVLKEKIGLVSEVASNIYTKDDRIEYVASIPSLKFWLRKNRKRKLFILDEAIKHAYRRRAMSSKTVNLIQVITEISKGHARAIIIPQDVKMVDKDLMNPIFNRAIFSKGGFYRRQWVTLHSMVIRGRERRWYHIPPTTVKFDPYVEAEFSEDATHPLFQHPDVKMFFDWCKTKDSKSMYRQSLEQKINVGIINRKIKRVGRILLTCIPKESEGVLRKLKLQEPPIE